MASVVCEKIKLSHKQFRALLKKFRRKKKRQQLAKARDEQEERERHRRESSPNYASREEERRRNEELYEQFEERERLRKNKVWLLREEQAQVEFRKKQKQIELEKVQREEERKRILEEFEKEQYLKDKTEEENKKVKSKKEEVLQEALSKLPEDNGPWHNPIAPAHFVEGKERDPCQFFAKTGCCRFGERCSRGHPRPPVSSTLLIRGMYTHYSIGQAEREDFDTDNALEYEERERYLHFRNFYDDVLPEFKKFGTVVQFKVCNNHEPHLRGNVYVQFSKPDEAIEAYKKFNGRYYASKQITCEFTNVIKWRSAICGLNFRKLCPKGFNCNFLHVFVNPTDEFWEADRDYSVRPDSERLSSRRRHHSTSSSLRGWGGRGERRRDSPARSRREEDRCRRRSPSEENGKSRRRSSKKTHHKKRRKYSSESSPSPTTPPPSGKDGEGSLKKRKHKKKKAKQHKKEKKMDDDDDS